MIGLDMPEILVPLLRVGTRCLQRSETARADAERRNKPVSTQSVGTRVQERCKSLKIRPNYLWHAPP
jgi:hypothetical protein